jgi:hypothetical protein
VFFRRNFRWYWSTPRSIAMEISKMFIPGRVPHNFNKFRSHLWIFGARWETSWKLWAPILAWSLNLSTVWHFLLGSCELIYVLYVRKQTCDNYADNIRHDHTKLVAWVRRRLIPGYPYIKAVCWCRHKIPSSETIKFRTVPNL